MGKPEVFDLDAAIEAAKQEPPVSAAAAAAQIGRTLDACFTPGTLYADMMTVYESRSRRVVSAACERLVRKHFTPQRCLSPAVLDMNRAGIESAWVRIARGPLRAAIRTLPPKNLAAPLWFEWVRCKMVTRLLGGRLPGIAKIKRGKRAGLEADQIALVAEFERERKASRAPNIEEWAQRHRVSVSTLYRARRRCRE